MAVMTVAILCLAACKKESKLQQSVRLANNQCPVSIGIAGDMTAITYDEQTNTVIIDYLMNEKYFNIDAMKKNTELLKENVYSLIATAEGDLKTMTEELLAADASLTLRWTGKESGKTVDITLTSKEIKAARESGEAFANPLKALESAIEVTNAQTPMKVDDATTMTSLTVVGDYATYEYTIDDSVIPFHKVLDQKEILKANIRQNALTNPDPALKEFINLCKKANKGLAYKYISSRSGDSFIIEFPVDEL